MTYRLINGESIAVLQAAKPESIDAIACDPPYAIQMMGSGWDNPRMLGAATGVSGGFQGIPAGTPRPDISKNDSVLFQQWCTAWGEAAMRVLKPGGYLLAFGSPRTSHRLVAGLEDAGFEVRDTIMWLYGEGMPKGKDLAKEIDKFLGVAGQREVVGQRSGDLASGSNKLVGGGGNRVVSDVSIAASDEARAWDGWTTCLKPMHEPIAVLRKPNAPGTTKTGRVSKKPMTNAENLLKHGVGALNVKACAVGDEDRVNAPGMAGWNGYRHDGEYQDTDNVPPKPAKGRMPGNVILDPIAAEQVDAEAVRSRNPSRFFYCPKVKPGEKNAGLPEGVKNHHPTPKPIALMEYLCTLVCPPGGVILDPFMGSGSTGIAALLAGFRFVGVELDATFVQLAHQRIQHWAPEARGEVVVAISAQEEVIA